MYRKGIQLKLCNLPRVHYYWHIAILFILNLFAMLFGMPMQALYFIDAERAKRDPIVIQDIPYYKSFQAVEAEVESLEVPPRPVEWTVSFCICSILINFDPFKACI